MTRMDFEGFDELGDRYDDVVSLDELDQAARFDRERDGSAALHDTEAEAGDETEIDDDFDMDDRAARQLGVALDNRDEPEPGLN